jgi:hypothetical protein
MAGQEFPSCRRGHVVGGGARARVHVAWHVGSCLCCCDRKKGQAMRVTDSVVLVYLAQDNQ